MDRKAFAPHIAKLTLRMALDVLEQAPMAAKSMILESRKELSLDSYAAERYNAPGVAYAVMTIDGPICIGGLQFTTPGVGVAWFVGSEMLPRYRKSALKICREVMVGCLKCALVHRIEAHVRSDDPVALKYAARVGFTFEHYAPQASYDRVAMGVFSMIEGRDAAAGEER